MYEKTDLGDNVPKPIPPREDVGMVMAVASGASKAVLYICCTVTFGILLSHCSLDQATILACEKACSSQDTKMESVTSQKCSCVNSGNSALVPRSEIWVLP